MRPEIRRMMGMKIQRVISSSPTTKIAGCFGLRCRRFWLPITVLFGLLVLPAIAGANTLISQGFLTNSNQPVGSIVSLQKNSSNFVNAANASNADNILGVVIGSDGSQVSVSSSQTNQVQVATNGVEAVLVSDINGKIAVGDPITASPIGGVGMKATSNAKVVGIAQDSFPNSTSSVQSYTAAFG
jgi:hypothetical protein